MEDKTLNPKESLQLIGTMIENAKHKLADDSFQLIFWGWLVFSCAIINYVGIQLNSYYGYYVWPILMPIGGIVSYIEGRKQKQNEKVKTYVDTYLGYSWSAFIVATFIVLIFIGVHGVKITYFFLMILYGMATFISGGILNFKPLILGSLFSFAFAILSVFLNDNASFLCISGALLFSYIIPGHLLKSKFKSQVNV